MRTAMGSAQWLTLTNFPSTSAALETLRANNNNLRILASDLQDATDIRQIDWDGDDRSICIVMGNEESGISHQLRQAADERFTLPMVGFAESFNLSVATAITLAHMSAASVVQDGVTYGPIRPGDLSQAERNCLFLKGLLNSVPQKRMATALLRKHGIELPDAIQML